MHLDDERIQRLLHGELGSVDTETRRHLAECDDCRDLIEQARVDEARIFGLLARVDHELPAVEARVVFGRGESAAGRWGRRAAAILVGTAIAGVAYAAPGSPVPGILERLVRFGDEVQGGPPPSEAEHQPTGGGGIAVEPTGGLVIDLSAAGKDAVATVALSDGDEVVVRAVEGTATFSSDPGVLSVLSSGRAQLEVLIPRSATSVEVRIGAVPVFRKLAEGAVTALQPDSTGRYRIPLGP
jgi:hypothetical protein